MKRPNAQSQLDTSSPIYEIATETTWDGAELLSRALAGDEIAENTIYRRHVRYLLNLATRLTRSVSDGDDVVQDTFALAFRKLDTLDNPNAMQRWLTRILMTQIRRRARVKRLRAFFGFKQDKADATLQMCAVHDARPDLRAELQQLDESLQNLPEKWRTIWMLHRIEGMSILETAQAASCSVATVKRYVAKVDKAVQKNRRSVP